MTEEVRRIMLEFADDTGLGGSGQAPRRYLWTDAHAVCNFLGLYRRTGDDGFRHLALELVDQVHHVLGRHRDDDPRSGWISGLDDSEGEAHPTAGGLRIGKDRGERRPDESYDERAEWDRDGQYYHYLTKWMHALSRTSAVCGEAKYCRWAVELAKAAHAGFVTVSPVSGAHRLRWKMSIDLSYPLVASSGHHDPLDGFITYNEIGLCASRDAPDADMPALGVEIADTALMLEGGRWETDDPLGIGGLLFDAGRLLQLAAAGQIADVTLLASLHSAARSSLEVYAARMQPGRPADYRLAFRELGLSIGLHAVTHMQAVLDGKPGLATDSRHGELTALAGYAPLRREIEEYWREPARQEARSWLDHHDINRVMLATSLLPDEFLAV